MIRPPVDRGAPPPFHEMHEDDFEELSCALMALGKGAQLTDRYESKGLKQFGIDILVDLDGGDVEVASCKCYKALKKGQIAKWSDEFLEHWDSKWQNEDVRRFVLITSAHIGADATRKEILAEKQRFASRGVKYEVWGPRQLQELLRRQPPLVGHYLHPAYIETICGSPAAALVPQGGSVVSSSAAVGPDLAVLVAGLNRHVAARLDQFLENLRSGQQVADEALREVQAGPDWPSLDAKTRARVVRMRAHLRLLAGEMAEAERLADEADALHSQEEPRLRALIVFEMSGAEAALKVLGKAVTQEGAHLRASLLLETGDATRAAAVLDEHPTVAEDHPETLRLRAYVLLLSGDRVGALEKMEEAVETRPSWTSLRHSVAVFRYANALSPLAGPDRFLQPNPVDFALVRQDDRSQRLLHEAETIFDELARLDGPEEQRRTDRLFAFACLCNQVARQVEAATRGSELLAETPTWAGAAAWCLARGFVPDAAELRDRLERDLDAGAGDAEGAVLLSVMYGAEGRDAKALEVLNHHRDLFEGAAGAEMLRAWTAKLTFRAAHLQGAGNSEGDALDYVSAAQRASVLADWPALESLVEKAAKGSGRPEPELLLIGQLLASAGRFESLGPFVADIVSFETAEAIRLGATVAFQTGQIDLAREAIANASAFPGGRLPPDLVRMEVALLARSGEQGEALRKATALAQSDARDGQDLLLAGLTQLRTGNAEAAAPLIGAAHEAGQIPPDQAVVVGHALSGTDPRLAGRLLRDAIVAPTPPFLANALSLAFRLDLRTEQREIFQRAAEIGDASRTGLLAVSSDSLRDMLDGARQASPDTTEREYELGFRPNHLHLGGSAEDFLSQYRLSAVGAGASIDENPLFLVSGARVEDEVELSGDTTILVDLSALLVADRLGLRAKLEELGRRLRFAPSLPMTLLHLENEVRQQGPGVVDAISASLAAIAVGIIGRLSLEAPDMAAGPDGTRALWLVGDLTAHEDHFSASDKAADEPSQVPEVLSLAAVLDGLRRGNLIDDGLRLAALETLGEAVEYLDGSRPEPGDTLVLSADALVAAARTGTLDAVTRHYRCLVSSATVSALTRSAEASARRGRLASWVTDLRRWLGTRLADGTFLTTPEVSAAPAVALPNMPSRSLWELVNAPIPNPVVLWVDDRAMTREAAIEGRRTVSTLDILAQLIRERAITVDDRWAAVATLRRSRALFLPLAKDELLAALTAAPVVDGEVVETPALALIRRYQASAIDHSDLVWIGPRPADGPRGEVAWLLSARRVAATAIVAIWSSPGADDATRSARADWVAKNLRVGVVTALSTGNVEADASGELAILELASFLSGGLQVATEVGNEDAGARLAAYMSWVERTVLPISLGTDRDLARGVALKLKQLTLPLIDLPMPPLADPGIARRFVQGQLGRLATVLPAALADVLLGEDDFVRATGIRADALVNLAGHTFQSGPFWNAAATALRTGQSSVPMHRTGEMLVLTRTSKSRYSLRLGGALQGRFHEPLLPILGGTARGREGVVRELLDDLGFDPNTVAAEATRIASLRKDEDRVAAIVELRKRSPRAQRDRLTDLLKRGPVPWEEFAPLEPDALMIHLGLLPGDRATMLERLGRAAESLASSLGAGEAVMRLAALPVPLSADLVAKVGRLRPPARRNLVRSLLGPGAPPIRRLHGVRLVRHLVEAGQLPGEELASALARLLEGWSDQARLQFAATHQASYLFHPAAGARRWKKADEALVIAWLHGDIVTSAILASGQEPDRARRALAGTLGSISPDVEAVRLPNYDATPVSVGTLTPEAVLFHGLGYALDATSAATLAGSEALTACVEALMVGTGEDRTPSAWIYAHRSPKDDPVGSWMTSRPEWLLPEGAFVSEDAAREVIDIGFARLATGEAPLETWFLLGTLSRSGFDARTVPIAREALEVLRMDRVADPAAESGLLLLRMAATVASACASEAILEAFARRVVGAVGAFATGRREVLKQGGDGDEYVFGVLEALRELSRGATATSGWTSFTTHLRRLAMVWPEIAPLIRSSLYSLATHVHPANAAPLWATLNDLRRDHG